MRIIIGQCLHHSNSDCHACVVPGGAASTRRCFDAPQPRALEVAAHVALHADRGVALLPLLVRAQLAEVASVDALDRLGRGHADEPEERRRELRGVPGTWVADRSRGVAPL